MMLRPDLHAEQGTWARPGRTFDREPLLERIAAQLTDRLTMADLEAWSGRSARSIQLAFQRRFGERPSETLAGRGRANGRRSGR